MHLLVCYLNKLENARCNDKDLSLGFEHTKVNTEINNLLIISVNTVSFILRKI